MSDDRVTRTGQELGKAIASIAFSPLVHVARVVGVALGRPDLEGQAVGALQEDVVRFFVLLQNSIARIDEDLRSKIDGVELAEVVLQSTSNMGRTASTEKRRLMQNLVINGLTAEGDEIIERRLFVQAVLDLDVTHIAFMRDAYDADGLADSPTTELTAAIVQPLVSRGLVLSLQSSTGFSFDAPDRIPVSTTYELTPLGRRFLAYLAEPIENA